MDKKSADEASAREQSGPAISLEAHLLLGSKIVAELHKKGHERTAADDMRKRMFSELDAAVVSFTQAVSQVKEYQSLAAQPAGISLLEQYPAGGGSEQSEGFFLNPLGEQVRGRTAKDVAENTLKAMVSQAVAVKWGPAATDEEKFRTERERLLGALHRSGAYDSIFMALKTTLSNHWEAHVVSMHAYADVQKLAERSAKMNAKIRKMAVAKHEQGKKGAAKTKQAGAGSEKSDDQTRDR